MDTNIDANNSSDVSGDFITIHGERFYEIRNVDKMEPFFVSVVSNADHWLFASSSGGMSAGRVSPETALFPYVSVDKIHENTSHTGGKTLLRVSSATKTRPWEPFNREHDGRFSVSRNLYKNFTGNKLCYEEVNRDLKLVFRCTWASSDRYGFSRQCELRNLSDDLVTVELLDGLQNILPAGTPAITQSNASNLVDAYKWTELDAATGLGIYTLYSGISDRAEPAESLRANTVFCLGLEAKATLVSSRQIDDFRIGKPIREERQKRGIRGAYLVNAVLELTPDTSKQWQIIANIEQSQGQIVALLDQLRDCDRLSAAIAQSIDEGTDELIRIIASADGLQLTAEENVVTHHYANTLFNVLRGGTFDDQYTISAMDFTNSVQHFNRDVFERNRTFFDALPERQSCSSLLTSIQAKGDMQLERLCLDYLPVTFGRRHGDPSRPWNHFAIKLKDESGHRLLSYEGNWRDIFQNWEALTFSFPEFTEKIIARFVNASTMDGYNPYRINKQGIDWEVEELDDPWSYIGYWGDHQIIYLQKLLELSERFHPNRLSELLRRPVFSYANVPYRIKFFGALQENPKSTVEFDYQLADKIEQRINRVGADGKLVLNTDGEVYQVNLLEKLLVPLLAKLGNLVVDGGIWLNTQRPEWNDANNALVGHGLSMVTLYYMRRYIRFLQHLLATETDGFDISADVRRWLTATANGLHNTCAQIGTGPLTASQRYESLCELGQAASNYRERIYRTESFGDKEALPVRQIQTMLEDAITSIEHSINTNRRNDGLYNAYNLLNLQGDEATTDSLYPMLEGQVAALSSGAIAPQDACDMLESLFDSDIYRPDQETFMLYPDRQLPGFLEKNRIPDAEIEAIPILQRMLADGDEHIVSRDTTGCCRFNADFANVGNLNSQIDKLLAHYGAELETARKPLQELYEKVFNHRAFTGRSGGMFGFEGLGCVYWHMVSKLLLAVQENFLATEKHGTDEATRRRLGQLYYRVRKGIGFNKTPAEYGAFPNDPYSHTPRHAGARQPGMTGQVKEELLTRFGELGVRIQDGAICFNPELLRPHEFLTEPNDFRYLDVDGNWQEFAVSVGELAFTWCQVPVLYGLDDDTERGLTVELTGGDEQQLSGPALPTELSTEIFKRSGRIRKLTLNFHTDDLFVE